MKLRKGSENSFFSYKMLSLFVYVCLCIIGKNDNSTCESNFHGNEKEIRRKC